MFSGDGAAETPARRAAATPAATETPRIGTVLGGSPNSSQRFAAELKKNLAESHRACRAIQVECRYLVKDLEVELKQEIVDLVQEYDTKLKLAMSVGPGGGGGRGGGYRSNTTSPQHHSNRQSATKEAVAEHNEDTKQLIQMFDGRVNALREDTRADVKAVERRFDAALRSQQEHMRQTRVMVEAIETSLSNQIASIVEDTQNAFVSAFTKYSDLENTVAVLARKHSEMEAKMQALASATTAAHETSAISSVKSSKANALRAVAMLTKKVKKKKSKKSASTKEDNDADPVSGESPDEIPVKKKKSSKGNALRAVAMLTKKVKKKKKEKAEKGAKKPVWTKQGEEGFESDGAPSEAPSDAPSDASDASLASLASLSGGAEKTKKKVKGRRYKSRDANKATKLPSGSLGQYVLMNVKPYAKRPALVEASDTSIVTTFRTLVNRVQSCAIAMTYCGIRAHSTVVVSLPSTPHIPIVCLAASLIGATCVVVSPHVSPDELKRISAEVGGSDALFATSAAVKASPSLLGSKTDGGFEFVVGIPMSEEDEDRDVGGDREILADPPKEGDLQEYAYGELLALGRAKKKDVPPPPKVKGEKSIALFAHSRRCRAEEDRLVGFSHAAIMSTIVALAGRSSGGDGKEDDDSKSPGVEFGRDDVVAVALPFWDARVLCGVVLPALAAGACVVCPGAELTSADPSTILMVMTNHASREEGGACINKMWVERRSLRFIARHHGKNSSAPLSQMFPSLKGLYTPDAEATVMLEACAKTLGDDGVVCAVGGVVEMGGRVVSHLQSDRLAQSNPTRMLPLISGVECKILNPATKKMCPPGKRGLVMLKGPSMLAGKDYRNAARRGR